MIKIEVTGNSIPEVADKLLAIGHSLYSKTIVPIANGGTGAQTLEEVMGAAEVAPVNPTPAPKSAPVATVSESLRTTAETSSIPAPAASASEDEELEVVDLPVVETPALDFNADIRTLALQLVKKRDKAALEKILIYFGVDRASQVEPARMPELLDMIKAALG